MSQHPITPEDPTPGEHEPTEQEPRKKYADVSPSRRGLWVVGGLVGGYMIVRGLYGVFTGEEQQP